MASSKREKTAYMGVFTRTTTRADGLTEKMFYIRYRRGGRGGKQVEEPVGKASEGMTAAKANAIKADRLRGKEGTNEERRRIAEQKKLQAEAPKTVADAWRLYTEHIKGRSSEKADYSRWKLLAPLHERTVESLTTSDIDALSKLLGKKTSKQPGAKPGGCLSPQTIKHILTLLKRVLRFVDSRGLCPMPTGLRFTMPKVDNVKTEDMTEGELRRYMAALNEEPDQDAAAFLWLALLTGMRKGAILALQWADVDLDRGLLTLRGESAKNGKSAILPLSTAAADVLRRIRRTESPYVFPGAGGKQRTDFRRISRRVRNKAGLPKDFRPVHALRHVYASRLASNGVDLYTLQRLLTHGSPQMTQRYAHLADDHLRRSAEVAAKILDTQKD